MIKKLNGNQIKMIAIIAMFMDHFATTLYPHYEKFWWLKHASTDVASINADGTFKPDNIVPKTVEMDGYLLLFFRKFRESSSYSSDLTHRTRGRKEKPTPRLRIYIIRSI